MTIVAGFLLKDRVLLCGDTLVTTGIKIHQSKLIGFRHEGPDDDVDRVSLAFAMAGNEVNAKMAIDDCVNALKEHEKEALTFQVVKNTCRAAILNINRDYIDGRSEAEKQNAAFDLLVAAWLPRGGGLHLLSTANGGSGLISRQYDFLGSGYYFGHVIAKPMFRQNMPLEEAVLLAIQVLASAKKYDTYCGGNTEFMMISEGGALSDSVPYKALDAEGYIDDFEKKSRSLLLSLGNTEIDDSQAEAIMDKFCEECRRIRAYLRGNHWEYLMQFIKRLEKSKKPSLQSTTGDPPLQPPSPE